MQNAADAAAMSAAGQLDGLNGARVRATDVATDGLVNATGLVNGTGEFVIQNTEFFSGGAVEKQETFIEIFDAMRVVIPDLAPENVTVAYTASGLESADQPGVLVPQIEIALRDFGIDLVVAQHLGLPDTLTLPPVGASRLASSMVP